MKKNIDFGTVADLYDLYVAWEVDVPFFRDLCAGTAGEVLELMCGTGRLSVPLLRAGIRLCCVDYSREMLDVLRRKLREQGLAADVREADVRELDLGRTFERILLPFHSFSEILDPADRRGRSRTSAPTSRRAGASSSACTTPPSRCRGSSPRCSGASRSAS